MTSSLKNYGERRYLPYVFTEKGVFQLSGVLSSDIADEVSIFIMRAFVAMKNYLINNTRNNLNNVNYQIIDKLIMNDNKFIKIEENISTIFNELK